jgi:chlorosome envelope protein B
MANETTNEYASVVKNLIDVIGNLGQQQLDLISHGIKSVYAAIEPLGKIPAELFDTIVNACNQVLASVSSASDAGK